MTELWFESATILATRLKTREISARDLLEMFLSRAAQFDGAINAIIWRDEGAARDRADAADAAFDRGEDWGPLHGVPMTIKEAFDWVGSPSTWGDPVFKDNFPTQNRTRCSV